MTARSAASTAFVVAFLAVPPQVLGQEPARQDTVEAAVADTSENDEPAVRVGYGGKGFWLETADGNNRLEAELRFQFRFSYPYDQDPFTFEQANDDDDAASFNVNRARVKIGGHAYRPWLKYYMEYELARGALLDFRFMIEKNPALKFKVGQWKVHYNRERVISSGKQQMIERSIITRPFTIDRQMGVDVYGRVRGGGVLDFSYWAGAFTGMGRGGTSNDDGHLMYSGRLQWNPTGREVEFTGSDLEYHEQPALLVALGANTNRSPFTRFSSSGGGQLIGFEDGVAGQYRVNQFLIETAAKYRGFSWQHESHWKRIDDKVNQQISDLAGSYFQAGYFFHHLWDWVPEPLEIAFLYAIYDPSDSPNTDLVEKQEQFAGAVNWFFNGHRNKLTAEVSYVNIDDPVQGNAQGTNFRLQWDISV